MKNLFILMRQSLNNSLHILKTGLIEMLQIGQNFLILAGIPVSILKKFRRCDAEVFADIEEDLHGREAVPIFERINITGRLCPMDRLMSRADTPLFALNSASRL